MSNYYKNMEGDYITGIGTGIGDESITHDEYDVILSLIRSCPTAELGFIYKLKTDLTWEQVEAPAKETDPEISEQAALRIILGGEYA